MSKETNIKWAWNLEKPQAAGFMTREWAAGMILSWRRVYREQRGIYRSHEGWPIKALCRVGSGVYRAVHRHEVCTVIIGDRCNWIAGRKAGESDKPAPSGLKTLLEALDRYA